jgi:hypothetical protein
MFASPIKTREEKMKMKTPGRFVCLLLVVAAAGATGLNSAQERQMGGVGITVFADPNFRGKSQTFREDVPDLLHLGFNENLKPQSGTRRAIGSV